CEPMLRASIETPSDAVPAVVAAIARLGGDFEPPSVRGNLSTVGTVMPAARAQDLRRQIPGLTSGEGVVETTFDGYRPVSGAQPTRATNADRFERVGSRTRAMRRGARLDRQARETST
ncbi:MAG TPA: hypothetical protein VK771_04415, partial [Acidimicrobiia bacterium]|nr:hypothetical protein [Acidimicrobiia bacterium]